MAKHIVPYLHPLDPGDLPLKDGLPSGKRLQKAMENHHFFIGKTW